MNSEFDNNESKLPLFENNEKEKDETVNGTLVFQ